MDRTGQDKKDLTHRILQLMSQKGLGPGAQLPSINDLAKTLSVSRGSIREALMKLSTLGLVDIRHGRGVFVTEKNGAGLFRTALEQTALKEMSIPEIIDARVAVETMISRLAAERLSEGLVAELSLVVEEMEKSLDGNKGSRFFSLDESFHDILARGGANRILGDLASGLRDALCQSRQQAPAKELLEMSLNYHRQIAQAVAERDGPRAAELTENHIRSLDEKIYNQGMEIHCGGLGTGSLGGTFYTMGLFIAREVAKATWIKPVVHLTGGGIENVRLVQEKRAVLSITQAETATQAFHGRGEFDKPLRDLRVLCCLPGLTFQMAALASGGIRRIQDLAGKGIALGAHGGAAVGVAKKILSAYGLEPERDYRPQVLPLPGAIELLRKEEVHALCFLSAGPSPSLLELGVEEPLRLLSLDEEPVEDFLRQTPFWYPDDLSRHTYPGQSEKIRSIGTPTILVTHKDLPDRDAYAISSVIFDHIKEIAALTMTSFSSATFSCDTGLPFHPGTRRANGGAPE